MTTQTDRDVVTYVNPNMNSIASKVRDFSRMNPLEYDGSKLEEDPQEFVE